MAWLLVLASLASLAWVAAASLRRLGPAGAPGDAETLEPQLSQRLRRR